MIAISNIDLYNLLRQKIGDTEAKAVTEYIDIQVESKFMDARATLATKEDIAIVRKEIAESKTDMIKWVFTFFAALSLMIMGLYLKK